MNNLQEINKDNEKSIEEGTNILYFHASWCKPCEIMSTVIEDLAEELNEKVKIFKIDVEENSDISLKYSIGAIPTILIIKNGEVVDSQIGVNDLNLLKNTIEAYL